VGKTILIVDDQDDVRRILERMLRSLGYAVLSAAGGEDALALDAAHAGPVHVLITDLEMPGIDGRQLARLLQQRRPSIGVLFLSGQLEDLEPETSEGGDFLLKPCTMKELSASLSRLIEGLPFE
jgi:two-component system, cell cycle sensor histidine kinase and response regulator CckA